MHGNELQEKIMKIIDNNSSEAIGLRFTVINTKRVVKEIIKFFEKEFDITIDRGIENKIKPVFFKWTDD